MMSRRCCRVLVAFAAALSLSLSASTGAFAAPAGDTKADYPAPASVAPLGDTKADYPAPALPAKLGDTPADHPIASPTLYRPPATIPATHPQSTIVRDGDSTVPITIASAVLLVALGGFATALVRIRMEPRPSRGV